MQAQNLEAMAGKLVGTPFVLGGSAPERGFDCLGLVQWVYRQQGVALPRDYVAFIERFHQVEHPEPMDLVAMCTAPGAPGVVTHVGVYLGRHRFLHAWRETCAGISRTDDEKLKARIHCFLRLNGRRPWVHGGGV